MPVAAAAAAAGGGGRGEEEEKPYLNPIQAPDSTLHLLHPHKKRG